MQIGSTTQKWMGLFTPFDVLIGVKAYSGERECMIFMYRMMVSYPSQLNCKCILLTEWTFSTTSQTILEMVVGYKNEYKNCLFPLVVGS